MSTDTAQAYILTANRAKPLATHKSANKQTDKHNIA